MLKKLKPSIHWLLVLIPAAFLVRFVPQWHSGTALFLTAAGGIIPLAGIMGQATEQLAGRMGPAAGGLLNATFGNAAELIIGLVALHKGLTGVVKASITGSIIGNVLLVFGVAALAGGLKFPQQRFNRSAVQTSTTSLMLAAIGLLIPTVFHYTAAMRPAGWSAGAEQKLSVGIAVVLLATYACTLFFSLIPRRRAPEKEAGPAAHGETEQEWSIGKALFALCIATALVAVLSEFLTDGIEGAREKLGVTEAFIGTIIIAIVGNAAEHSTAVWMARKNKMDLSLAIAIGSSLQMALFVAPLLVMVSGALGHPMDLEFSIPEVVAVIVSVHLASEISKDGRTNWLEGAQLLSVYLILVILFYFLPPAG